MSNRSIPSPSAQADASESDDFLLSARQSAQLLGCSPAAIRRWTQQRRLQAFKVGRLTRYRRKDVLGLAKARP